MSGFFVGVQRLVGRWLCGMGWHQWRPTTLEAWELNKTNFKCRRCGGAVRRFDETQGRYIAPNSVLDRNDPSNNERKS